MDSMDDFTRMATRLGYAATLACAMSVTGCSIDGAGNIRLTHPQSDSAYGDPHAAYWHGQRATTRGGGFGVQPRIDTSKLKFTAPK